MYTSLMTSQPSKHLLYELSVQSPRWQVDYLPQFHRFFTGVEPHSFREDFCGTGKISCEWVQANKKNIAVGLDLDSETLNYANKINKGALTKEDQKKVKFIKQNVLKPTKQKFDWIGAFNFSFFVFHERKVLLQYARAAFKSLNKKGTFFLELSGGKGFLKSGLEKQKVNIKNYGKVTQIWEQHQFDPITSVNDYSIHFQLPNGKWLNDAFQYHWRIWGIREVQEILEEAGFKKTIILWEKDGEFLPTENAEHANSWVAFVVGVKK